jgi:hypothetical protein
MQTILEEEDYEDYEDYDIDDFGKTPVKKFLLYFTINLALAGIFIYNYPYFY